MQILTAGKRTADIEEGTIVIDAYVSVDKPFAGNGGKLPVLATMATASLS